MLIRYQPLEHLLVSRASFLVQDILGYIRHHLDWHYHFYVNEKDDAGDAKEHQEGDEQVRGPPVDFDGELIHILGHEVGVDVLVRQQVEDFR